MSVERGSRWFESNRHGEGSELLRVALASAVLVASVWLGAPRATAQAASTLATPPSSSPSSPQAAAVPSAAEEPTPPTREDDTHLEIIARALLEERVDDTQHQRRHVHPRLGSGIVGVVLGVGMIAGGLVARPRIIDRECNQLSSPPVKEIDTVCRRGFTVALNVFIGAGAVVTTSGSLKIVVHSVRRSRARRAARDAQHRLDEFEREHTLELRPHVAVAPRASVFGLSLRGSF